MFIHIPHTLYEATASGLVNQDVTCEKCGHEYSYYMSRIVDGSVRIPFSSSRGPERAVKTAQANLTKALSTEHDNVPCPECQWHQSAHVAFVRSQLYPELKNLAGAFFIFAAYALAVVLFFLALSLLIMPIEEMKASSIFVFALMVLAVASPGILLRGLRRLLALRYRPNG